ncbi:vesicle-associated membrane protein 4-like [Homarus americanus]|uniref:vesicle-associated membrane protein 4-like n=1 Tax=Homarus americanus TaxID=6706 RepID=UPI001C47DD9F|nr:vesicle-associated membrane protein 4-like [Homarus americanus]
MPPKRNLTEEDLDDADDDEVEKLISKDEDVAEDEEDFFLKGPSSKKTVRFASDKLKDVRVQIAEVTDVMRDNVGRLLERGDQLDNLQDRSEGLATTSDQFRTSATRLRRNMWWQNTRAKMCIGGVVTVVLLVIFVPVIIKMNS